MTAALTMDKLGALGRVGSAGESRATRRMGKGDAVRYWETILVILAALYSSLALADDFKTTGGKEYKDAKVSRVEPDGIVLRTKSGISKVYFAELPKEVQERFHYDAAKGNAYSAEKNASLETLRKQQEQAIGRQEATPRSASKPAFTPDPIKPMATLGIEPLPRGKTAAVPEELHRVGAMCRDGSESGVTGRGGLFAPWRCTVLEILRRHVPLILECA